MTTSFHIYLLIVSLSVINLLEQGRKYRYVIYMKPFKIEGWLDDTLLIRANAN